MTVMLPLPGIMTPSMVSSSPPTSVQARPVTDADLIVRFDLAEAEARHAEIVGEVVGGDLHRFFFVLMISVTALRPSFISSRSRLRTPASRV